MSPFLWNNCNIEPVGICVIFWDGWNLKIRYPQHLQAFVLVFWCFWWAKHNMAVSTSSLVHGCPVDRRSVGFIQNRYVMIQNCGLARMAPDPVDAVAILSALRVFHPGTWTAQWTGSFFFFFIFRLLCTLNHWWWAPLLFLRCFLFLNEHGDWKLGTRNCLWISNMTRGCSLGPTVVPYPTCDERCRSKTLMGS